MKTGSLDISMLHLDDAESDKPEYNPFAGALAAIKPALMYGDNINYHSDSVELLRSIPAPAAFDETSLTARALTVKVILPLLRTNPALQERLGLAAQAVDNAVPELRRYLADLESGIEPVGQEDAALLVRTMWDNMYLPAISDIGQDLSQLGQLTESGRVEIRTLEETAATIERPIRLVPGFSDDRTTERYVELVIRTCLSILGDASAHPAFFGRFARMMERITTRGAEVPGPRRDFNLATEWLGYLPTFSRASIAEVLDIRVELEQEIDAFRSAMTLLSEEISPTAPEDEFRREARRLWRNVGEPAVRAIDDAVAENRYIRQVADHYLAKADGLVPAAGIIIGATSGRATLSAVAAAATAVVPLTRAWWDHFRSNDILHRNRFYFFYAAGRALEGP